jgi:hypothetical protein
MRRGKRVDAQTRNDEVLDAIFANYEVETPSIAQTE